MVQSPFFGCVCAVLGNLAISIGLNVQKFVHNSRAKRLNYAPLPGEETQDETTPVAQSTANLDHYLKNPLWWVGMCLLVTGEVGNFVAYGYAPAMFVAPLGTVSLISNAIIAPLALHERMHKTHIFGVCLALVGTVCILLVSSMTSAPFPEVLDMPFSEFLLKQFCSLRSLFYFGVVAVGSLLLNYYPSTEYRQRHLFVDLSILALYGGLTVVATRGLSSLLSVNHAGALGSVFFWILAAVAVATSVLQVKHLNFSLAHFDVTRVIPMQFVLFTLAATVSSAIVFRDFVNVTHSHLAACALGFSLMFFGVFLISRPAADASRAIGGGLAVETVACLQGQTADHLATSSTTLCVPGTSGSAVPSVMSSRRTSVTASSGILDDKEWTSFPTSYTKQRSAQVLLDSFGTHEARRLELFSIVSTYQSKSASNFYDVQPSLPSSFPPTLNKRGFGV